MSKAIECLYPANAPKRRVPRPQQNHGISDDEHGAILSSLTGPSSVGNALEVSNPSGVTTSDSLELFDPDVIRFDNADLDWNGIDINFDSSVDSQTTSRTPNDLLGVTAPLDHQEPASSHVMYQMQGSRTSSGAWNSWSPYTISRSLIHRPRIETRPQRTSNIMLRCLGSYPLMIARQNTVPPFIHPSWINLDVPSNDMEPLNNCISLMHMLGSGVQGSRKLFWKNVRLECERFCEASMNMNKWELLVALQALSIYIIIRLEEGETDHNNFDSLLVAAVAVVSRQFNRAESVERDQIATHDTDDLGQSWKEWIFGESKRRICVIYRIVNLLVHFEPAAICDLRTDLVIAPLPAKKLLWKANDELSWRIETEKEPRDRATFGLAATGDLVRVDEELIHCHSRMLSHGELNSKPLSMNMASWEEWCAEMDEFGSIVVLAASLIE